jgi:hypothetical protein
MWKSTKGKQPTPGEELGPLGLSQLLGFKFYIFGLLGTRVVLPVFCATAEI